jgi:peptide deformylase
MKYNLVSTDDETYNSVLDKFDFNDPPIDPVELAKDLQDIMVEKNGLGLAANQVGLPYRVAVFNCAPEKLTMYNPSIVYYNEDYSVAEEGCLSHPGFFVKIRRPSTIRVRYQDETGEFKALTLSDLMARAVQHEVDHLNGIDFLERASKINIERAKARDKKMKRKAKQIVKGII